MDGYEILDYEPVNEVDEPIVNEIAKSIKENGWNGMPILTYGNCLITGSHRKAALIKLYNEDFDLGFECAVDVSDLLEEFSEEEIFTHRDALGYLFEGTWVEEYKDEIEEW